MRLISVDTGGTFTDVVAHLNDGTSRRHKLPSTPDDPSQAVLDGIKLAIGAPTQDPQKVVHGSTVATNALLEGREGRAAFVTTAGFEDTLAIGRQNRPSLYALEVVLPPPPMPRCATVGARERVAFDGSILEALTAAAIDEVVAALRALGPDAVAVSLLHSYANPAHEIALGDAIANTLPGVHLTLSHQLLPEIREFERGMTCAVNAAVAPKMAAYLGALAESLADHDDGRQLWVMGSSGGSLRVDEAIAAPVHTVVSGPAGGVVGALEIARRDGFHQIVTFDMGGTSTDVALCDGELSMTTEGTVGPYPVKVPMVDICTVGAGGGSIARLDPGGALVVGPRSAGAVPGPAAYGRGGTDATVTDANAVLGYIRPDTFLGGAMMLDLDAARGAVSALAHDAELTVDETANGIRRVAEVTMTRAIKRISIERGHDPRTFALVSFGGAGGLHACALAEALGMTTVLVPADPGLLSAVGMLHAPSSATFSRAIMARVQAADDGSYPPLTGLDPVRKAIDALVEQSEARLANHRHGTNPQPGAVRIELDVRYEGQSYEIRVPADQHAAPNFVRRHTELYGMAVPDRALEIVAARAYATCAGLAPPPPSATPPQPGAIRHMQPDPHVGVIVARDQLFAWDRLAGPALITEYSATTLLPRGWELVVRPTGTLVIVRQPHHRATP